MQLRRATAVLIAAAWLVLAPASAMADGLSNKVDGKEARAGGSRQVAGSSSHRSSPQRAGKSKYTYLPKVQYQEQMKAYRSEVAAAIRANTAAANARGRCIDTADRFGCNRFASTALPTDPNIRQAGDPAAPTAPALSPREVAYIASARIRLSAPNPRIGPSPDLNEWKMAAVGYPLWLWADGNLDPAPVSDSVEDISVGLDAHLVKVVFDMGDGHKVTCTDLSRKWTSAVAPGAESPSCGYRYPKPSLPAGSYEVTANAVWAIDWNINGTTGTIPFYQSASTTIPVGELQVLVR